MQPYQRTREKREKNANVTGILATLGIHAAALVVLLTNGLTYLDPPPPERTSLLIEFEEEVLKVKPIETRVGRQPQAEEVDLTREVDLSGDDRPFWETDAATGRGLHLPHFPGMSQKDNNATTPHSASEAKEGFKAGQPDGNTKEGKTEGSANAHVKGRNVVGSLPRPSYNSQTAGTVVVQIKVDQYGNVTEAIAGAEGTTVTDKTLWTAARNAALKAHFNMDANAPAVQTGTITYIFKLK